MKKLTILILASLATLGAGAQLPAEKKIDASAIRPRYRQWAVPRGGETVRQNPASMLWPAQGGKTDQYRVRLSQNPGFPDNATTYGPWQDWAVYTTHKPLEEGKWYWQWAVKSTDAEPAWSETLDFVVDENSRRFPTPTLDEFTGKLRSKPHHRMYVGKDELEAFRSRNKQNDEAKTLVRKARSNLDMELIPEAPTRPRDTTGMNTAQKKILMTFMYHQFGDKVKQPIYEFSMAYLLTGEREFADAAIKHALHVAAMPIDSHATQEDFNKASIMLALATAYDTTYDLLTDEQKQLLLKSIVDRGDHFYRHYTKEFETHSMDNHVWQHTLRRFFLTSVATLGDIPQAEKWLSYCYEAWCCRFPVLGGEDGGWHDGSSYYAVNFETFIMVPFLLGKYTGADFFDLPYFHNIPDWLAYSFPKGSYSTGFGDGMEKMNTPPTAYMEFADALARELKNPTARWYADQQIGNNPTQLYKAHKFALYRMLTDKPIDNVAPEAPAKNTSKFFPDAGFSLMHTDVADASDDLMAVFMGLPFGSTGHAHAAHNGFTINYGGKQLFGASGHYSNFNDRHTLTHYRTRGHNTVLVDGMAQAIGENSYGWLARFHDNPALTYTLGDATHAYDSMRTRFWINRMKLMGVEYSLENGFGDPGVTRFRRHFVYLRPNVIVIYDELEAEKPVEWTWLLHSYNRINAAHAGITSSSAVTADNGRAKATLTLVSDRTIEQALSNEFFSPAVNWKERTGPDGKPLVYEKHWHAEFTPAAKSDKQRFLAIIVVDPQSGTVYPAQKKGGRFEVSGWSITAELDGNKPARLEIRDKAGNSVAYNTAASAVAGSTVIATPDKRKVELTDQIPASVRLP